MSDPTSLAADIHKIVSDAGTDVETAVKGIMGLLNPTASPPKVGTLRAAVDASVVAGKAWGSALGPLSLPLALGAGAVMLYDNFTFVKELLLKL